jgi:hypothetical protein
LLQHVECRSIDASEDASGDDSDALCLDASLVSHGAAQVVIHSQGIEVVNADNADMAMY